MRTFLSITASTALALALAFPSWAAPAELGLIDFPNSGSAEAQEPFLRGILLLHSFEYEDAREAFQQARRIDPGFALAYWGEAMTHNHPLWRQQNLDAAREALARFAPTPRERLARTSTERERGWMRAADLLFGEGDKIERDVAFSEAMGELAARHPDDLEARAFHALSILGTAQAVRDFRTYMRAGSVAEEVFAENPLHPGAAHYMIHSYDDPIHAPLGLRAARVYAKIAPAASHAQHMISHIYVALGRWAESVDANVKAVEVSVERRKRKDLGPDAVSYHALHWLEYSYLQLGQIEKARETLEMMTRYANESGSESARWHHAAMRAAWVVETRGRPAPPAMALEETGLSGAVASLFGTGYAALLRGDREAAREAVSRLAGRHESAAETHCSMGTNDGEASEQDLLAADVMRKSLLAAIELDAGDPDRALEMITAAVAIEESMPLDYGPPAIVKPSHELYGEMLLSLGRPGEARIQFEKALRRAPRRSLSLEGLVRAASSEGDATAVAEACGELATTWAGADETIELPAPCAETNVTPVRGFGQRR